jgi:hypothetical protein
MGTLTYKGTRTTGQNGSGTASSPLIVDYSSTYSATGVDANATVTSITAGSVGNANTDGSSSSGTYRMNLQVKLGSTWYTFGYITVPSRMTGSNNFTGFTDTSGSTAGLRSLMGKTAISGLRGQIVAGYFSIFSSGNGLTMTATTELDTTACGAPTSLSVSPALSEGDATLSWSGAWGGVANSITSYVIQYAEGTNGTAWGAWTALKTVSLAAASGSTTVSPSGTRGSYRKYRIYAQGTAGYDWASPWKESSNSLRRNQAPVAPASLSASPAIYESGNVSLSWPAGTDPDNNLSGYTIQYRTSMDASSWGTWIFLTDVGTVTSYAFAATMTRGQYIQFQIRAKDALGVTSGWRASGNVRKNQLPLTPAFVFPVSGKTCCSGLPYIKASMDAEPDGQTQKLQIKIDEGAWADLTGLASGARTVIQRMTGAAMGVGSHTIYLRSCDSQGAVSAQTQRTVTVADPAWSRTIGPDSVMVPDGVSHIAEIQQMLDCVNDILAFYGLTAVTLPGTLGYFRDWLPQMTALQAGLESAYAAVSAAVPAWISPERNAPRADVVNQIRGAIAL